MKKLLLSAVALALSVVPSFAQSARPKGFLGLPWGSSPDATISQLRQRAGVTVADEVSPGAESIEAVGGTFAGQPAGTWRLEFIEGKLAVASVVLKRGENPGAQYRELKQNLVAKYGSATGEKKISEDPDERRVRIINGSSRRPDLGTTVSWKFKPTLGDKSEMTIELSGGGDFNAGTERGGEVTVRYSSDTLRAAASKASPEKAAAKVAKPVKAEDL